MNESVRSSLKLVTTNGNSNGSNNYSSLVLRSHGLSQMEKASGFDFGLALESAVGANSDAADADAVAAAMAAMAGDRGRARTQRRGIMVLEFDCESDLDSRVEQLL